MRFSLFPCPKRYYFDGNMSSVLIFSHGFEEEMSKSCRKQSNIDENVENL